MKEFNYATHNSDPINKLSKTQFPMYYRSHSDGPVRCEHRRNRHTNGDTPEPSFQGSL